MMSYVQSYEKGWVGKVAFPIFSARNDSNYTILKRIRKEKFAGTDGIY